MNYSKTNIYKIVCKDSTITETYVGNTVNFNKRKSHHKYNCTNKNSKLSNLKVYTFMRENGGWNNWNMVLIEEYPCESRSQAEQRERYWIETLNATLNCVIPSRTKEEYFEMYKDKLCQSRKQYYEEHREETIQFHRQYYKKNQEELLQKAEQYREENREIINERQRKVREQDTPILCECGSIASKANLARHKRSKKHQQNLEQNAS